MKCKSENNGLDEKAIKEMNPKLVWWQVSFSRFIITEGISQILTPTHLNQHINISLDLSFKLGGHG